VYPIFSKFVVCNPLYSSPSLTILVLLWFILISLVFFSLSEVLFSGLLQFNGEFVRGQNNSKYRVTEHLKFNMTGVILVDIKVKVLRDR